jgi:hypothetical protein
MNKILKVALIGFFISLAFNFIAVNVQASENIVGVDISKWKTYKSVYGVEFKYPRDRISVDSDFADSRDQYYRLLSVLIENKHKQGISGQTSIVGSLEVDDIGLGSKDSFIIKKEIISNGIKWECGILDNGLNPEGPILSCISNIDSKYYKFIHENREDGKIIDENITEAVFYAVVDSFKISEPNLIFGRMDFVAFGFLNDFIFDSDNIVFLLVCIIIFVGILKIGNLFYEKWKLRQGDNFSYAYNGIFVLDSFIIFVISFIVWMILSTIAEAILGALLYISLEPFSSVGLAIVGTVMSSFLVRKIWRKNDMVRIYFEVVSILVFAILVFLYISYSLSNLHGIGA